MRNFVREAESLLGSRVLGESGKVLYSPARTLTRGAVYLVGSNPGGDRDNPESYSIQESLHLLAKKTTNDFFCESWRTPKGRLLGAGEHHLQIRLRQLFKLINLDLYETCSSNLIFRRSTKESEVSYARDGDADKCWEVHLLILEIC
jgi:hypothetical protein